MIIVKPRLKIVATILTKNEEDIIGTNIEHHLKQGVWKFIVTDNNSSDRTREIAASYPEVVEIIDEPGDDHNQSKWVTRMAQIACKLKPDWIVHLDADELWCGLMRLSEAKADVVGCERMYLHPPGNLDHYLDFDALSIPQECKVAHRPDPTFVVTHGNHGIEGVLGEFTRKVWRHHYPIRSYEQWQRKSMGHEALMRRNAPCERWKMWYNLNTSGMLSQKYQQIVESWQSMIDNPQAEHFHRLLEFWATPDMITFFKNNPDIMPKVGHWKPCVAKSF